MRKMERTCERLGQTDSNLWLHGNVAVDIASSIQGRRYHERGNEGIKDQVSAS